MWEAHESAATSGLRLQLAARESRLPELLSPEYLLASPGHKIGRASQRPISGVLTDALAQDLTLVQVPNAAPRCSFTPCFFQSDLELL